MTISRKYGICDEPHLRFAGLMLLRQIPVSERKKSRGMALKKWPGVVKYTVKPDAA